MAIEISCIFVGGPQGTETLKLHQFHCLDQLALGINWLRPGKNGSVEILKGDRSPNTEWLSATRAIYRKAAAVSNGEAHYQFVRLEEVRRCEKVLESKGRRCRHEAEAGNHFCNTHRKKP